MADSHTSIPLCVSGFVSRKMKQKKQPWSRIPESGLKLANVIKFASYAEPWHKVDDDSRFGEFHAKFWGKSMPGEGEQALQSAGMDDDAALDSKTQSRNHSAGDVTMDDASEDTDDTDADADSDSDADDELTSGCHELDVSPNPISDEPKIWIRADYLRIYKCVESRYDLCYKRCKAQSVVLTGQPGNGKSMSLVYALRRRCAERKPVIWYDGSEGYIFVEDGVYKMAADFHVNEFKIFVWTLVDSDQAKDGIPPDLVRRRTRLFVLYASSPNADRWKRLHKTVDTITVVMNPWTWREMLRALPLLLPDSTLTDAEIYKTFEQLGPTPRIVKYLSDSYELEQYKREVDTVISDITPGMIKNMVSDAKSLSLEKGKGISNKLTLISRAERDELNCGHIVAPITEFIKSRLASKLRLLARNQQIELYTLFARVPQTKIMSGLLFEAIGQVVLPEGLGITLLEMVRLNRKPTAKSRPRWYSSHTPLSNKSLEAKRRQAQSQTIQIPPTTIQEFTSDDILSLTERVFYVPVSDNEEALDAFLLLDGVLYIFQFTVGKGHSIKPGFVKFFRKCKHVPLVEEWKFVFLIPPRLTLICPDPNFPSLRNLNPYSAQLDVQRFTQ